MSNLNNHNLSMQNILFNQQNQINHLTNPRLGLNYSNNIENSANIYKNLNNTNEVFSGMNSAFQNNLIYENLKRENTGKDNPNIYTINNNNLNKYQLNNKINNTDKNDQQSNTSLSAIDKSLNLKVNKLKTNDTSHRKDIRNNENSTQQDLMNKKRKRGDLLNVKNERTETFKEMFFKDKMSNNIDQNRIINDANYHNYLNLKCDINNTYKLDNYPQTPLSENKNFQEMTNKEINNTVNNTINPIILNNYDEINSNYLIDNQNFALNQNLKNLNNLAFQYGINNEIPINLQFFGNINSSLNQNNFNNQMDLKSVAKSFEFINQNTDINLNNNHIISQKLMQNNTLNLTHGNYSNYQNELNKNELRKNENSLFLNNQNYEQKKNYSNNLESLSENKTCLLTENNIISPKQSQNRFDIDFKNNNLNSATEMNKIPNHIIKTETNSNTTGNHNEKLTNSVNDPTKTESQLLLQNDILTSFALAKPEQLMLLSMIKNNFPIGNFNIENLNSFLKQFTNYNDNNEYFNSVILNANDNHEGMRNYINTNNANDSSAISSLYFQQMNNNSNNNVSNEIENIKNTKIETEYKSSVKIENNDSNCRNMSDNQ